jgi:predicted dienelactone hydrolase
MAMRIDNNRILAMGASRGNGVALAEAGARYEQATDVAATN